jgi:hypothetical protein
MAYVYRHIRLDKNEPFYIGIGSDKTYQRAYKTKGRSKYWENISINGYEVEILMDNITWEDACKKEVEFISMYGRKDLGQGTLVNLTNGGDGSPGVIVSEKTRGYHKVNNKGKSNPFYGKKHNEETILKLKLNRQNSIMPECIKEKISKKLKGRKFSKETIEKMKSAQLGEKHPNAKKIINTLNNKLYSSVKEAALDNNVKYSSLYAMLTNRYVNTTSLKFL